MLEKEGVDENASLNFIQFGSLSGETEERDTSHPMTKSHTQ